MAGDSEESHSHVFLGGSRRTVPMMTTPATARLLASSERGGAAAIGVVLLGPSLVRAGCAACFAADSDLDVVASVSSRIELPAGPVDARPHSEIVAVVIVGSDVDGTLADIEVLIGDDRFNAVLPVLSVADRSVGLAVLGAGASGCVLLDDDPISLVAAIRAAARGEMPLSAVVGRWVVGQWVQRAEAPRLTARESEVLHLVGAGLANKQIARRLGISQPTVKHHLTRVFQRIGVTGRTEAAVWLQQQQARGDLAGVA